MASTGSRHDPFGAFRFKVTVDGVVAGGFSECSGLALETEVFEYKEGGVNDLVHRLPTRVKQGNLTLKRGVVDSALWGWFAAAVPGKISLKSGSVEIFDPSGRETVASWDFLDAYPRKVQGPDLNAGQSAVAVETVEIVHHGLERKK